LVRYIDQTAGMSADEAVTCALAHNGDLLAARKEIAAAQALLKQAGFRPNPKLDVEGSRQMNGKDNSVMVNAILPWSLAGVVRPASPWPSVSLSCASMNWRIVNDCLPRKYD